VATFCDTDECVIKLWRDDRMWQANEIKFQQSDDDLGIFDGADRTLFAGIGIIELELLAQRSDFRVRNGHLEEGLLRWDAIREDLK